MKWYERAAAKVLPPTVTGGTPIPAKPLSCHYCLETFTDSELAYAHVMAHPERDRRRVTRRVAA